MTPSKAQIDALISQDPHSVVRGLIQAFKTGKLIINTPNGELRLGVVTLRKSGNKVEIIPVNTKDHGMHKEKREALERAGWKFGDAADFLKMTEEERQSLDEFIGNNHETLST